MLDPREREMRNTDPCTRRQTAAAGHIYIFIIHLLASIPPTFSRHSRGAAERVLVSADSIYSRPGECVST